MTKRWDAAREASRRLLPKPRKMHGPVGPTHAVQAGPVCACGYHICAEACKEKRRNTLVDLFRDALQTSEEDDPTCPRSSQFKSYFQLAEDFLKAGQVSTQDFSKILDAIDPPIYDPLREGNAKRLVIYVSSTSWVTDEQFRERIKARACKIGAEIKTNKYMKLGASEVGWALTHWY